MRLVGVETPEARHPTMSGLPLGKEALAYTVQLVEGKKVRLEFDKQRKDKYKRLLAYVYVGVHAECRARAPGLCAGGDIAA